MFNAAHFTFATINSTFPSLYQNAHHSIKMTVILLSAGMGGKNFQDIRGTAANSCWDL